MLGQTPFPRRVLRELTSAHARVGEDGARDSVSGYVASIQRPRCVGSGRKADHVTDDRALKRAIRRRMEQTGEKYTEARRALLGSASSGERYPWYYEPYWENLRRRFEQQADEEGEAVTRASVYHSLHSLQLLFALTPFSLTPSGRGPSGPDAWLANRPPVECNAAVIEASRPLAAVGFGPLIDRNRQIVDRVLALIDERAAGASEQAQQAAESQRARLGFTVPRSESQRPSSEGRSTAAARPWGDRSKELNHDKDEGQLDHFLRHPLDKWFRGPWRGIYDPVLLELVDAWIDDLERNYAQLVKLLPPAWVEHVELDFEAVCEELREEDGHGSSSDWNTGLPSPARVLLKNATRGELGNRELVATQMLLVEGGVSPQPDGIAALPHESWIIRGHRLSDGTIMPCRGTYRLASARSV